MWYLTYIWEKTHPLHSFNMTGRVSKKFSAGEALEAIFADEDSKECVMSEERKLKKEKKSKPPGYVKDVPGEPGLCVEKDCFQVYHTKQPVKE